MTTREIDDHFFFGINGIQQFMVGNYALKNHNRFFLNLSDANKIDCLEACGYPLNGAVMKKGEPTEVVPVVVERKEKPTQMRLW